jgi:hypothetical protein
MSSGGVTSSTWSAMTTITPSPTPTSSTGEMTTWPATTYTLPLTSWGSTPNGFGDFNLGDRILQLVTSGSNGEKVVRGFLMGVAMGIILGGVFCCWVPCFGRGRHERRARRRRMEEQTEERQARWQAQRQRQQNSTTGSQPELPMTIAEQIEEVRQQQEQSETRPPNNHDAVAERAYFGVCWDRLQRRRQ